MISRLLAGRHHRRLFSWAAKIPDYRLWYGLASIAVLAGWVLVCDAHLRWPLTAGAGLLLVALASWAFLGVFCIPCADVPAVVLQLGGARTFSAHLRRQIPSAKMLEEAVRATLVLAQELGYSDVVLRSALFGRAFSAAVWHGWLVRTVARCVPGTVVFIEDDRPITGYAAFSYLFWYDLDRKHSVRAAKGLRAARMRVVLPRSME